MRIEEAVMESSRKANLAIVAKAGIGIVVATLLTAGLVWGVATELQRGFEPVYQVQQTAKIRSQREEQAAAAARARATSTRTAEAGHAATATSSL
jgi:hypothetical protein